ncbi:MAG: EamA family transporter [Candidatus Limnocylindrales bacterium]
MWRDSRARTTLANGGALIGPGSIFGLLSAFSWGAGDFAGGLVSRYASVLAAMLASQGIGMVATGLILLVVGEAAPVADSILWAAIAGSSGVAGLAFFYLALARGTMGVVAPLAALIGAGVPVLVAIINGETVDASRTIGIALALAAVVLISLPSRPANAEQRRVIRADIAELPMVVLAGLGFAGFFIGVDRATSDGSLWWPLTIVRLFGITLVVLAIVVAMWRRGAGTGRERAAGVLGFDRLRDSGRTFASVLPLFVLSGLGDLGGNVFFVFARGADTLAVAVVLSSLYPVVTTLLAALLLRERLRPVQLVGVALATLSVPLLR